MRNPFARLPAAPQILPHSTPPPIYPATAEPLIYLVAGADSDQPYDSAQVGVWQMAAALPPLTGGRVYRAGWHHGRLIAADLRRASGARIVLVGHSAGAVTVQNVAWSVRGVEIDLVVTLGMINTPVFGRAPRRRAPNVKRHLNLLADRTLRPDLNPGNFLERWIIGAENQFVPGGNHSTIDKPILESGQANSAWTMIRAAIIEAVHK